MPDDPAFIRTIAAAPTDDAPRLIYADVLDERGDEASVARAEFIRVQIEKARLEPQSPRWNELWYRDTALLDWARRWRQELPAVRGVGYGGYIRGFIDRVELSVGKDLPADIEAVFATVPVRQVDISELGLGFAGSFFQWEALLRVRVLVFRGGPMSAESVERLIERGPWPNLVCLHVRASGYLPAVLEADPELFRRLADRFARVLA